MEARELRGEPLRCPADGSRLVQTERSEILIDACPECRGVWLDRGELDSILVKERQWASGDADEDFFGEVEDAAARSAIATTRSEAAAGDAAAAFSKTSSRASATRSLRSSFFQIGSLASAC